MANRRTYYDKEISWSRQLFHETDIAKESVSLRTIHRKLTLNLTVIFNSFSDISFLRYVTKIFCLLLFSEKIRECFKLHLSVVVFVLSVASILYKDFGENPRKIYYKSFGPQMYSQQFFFWKFAEVLGQDLKSSL